MLGPPEPDPTMDLTALDIVKTVVMDSPNKLFVGGLPCDWSEDQVRRRSLGACCDIPNNLHTASSAGPACSTLQPEMQIRSHVWATKEFERGLAGVAWFSSHRAQ
jgi:hypothetical protein